MPDQKDGQHVQGMRASRNPLTWAVLLAVDAENLEADSPGCDWIFHFGAPNPTPKRLPDGLARGQQWPIPFPESDINSRHYRYGIKQGYGEALFCSSDCLFCPSLSSDLMRCPASQQFDTSGMMRK